MQKRFWITTQLIKNNMPLYKGYENFNKNLGELVDGKVGKTRKKAINTIARKYGLSKKEARFKQALIIAKSKAMEK